MSDVRLTATNPEDSSVVAVACNARGELMTVAPVIEKIPNDVEIEGDLTVTGTINGDTGGSGLPPVGPDGSILAVVEGAPAWVGKSDLCAPEPSGHDVVIRNQEFDPTGGSTSFYTEQGMLIDPSPDWDTAARELEQWNATTVSNGAKGVSAKKVLQLEATFDVKNCLGMVLEVNIGTKFSMTANHWWEPIIECEHPNLQLLTSYERLLNSGEVVKYLPYQWFCSREEAEGVNIKFHIENSFLDPSYDFFSTFQSWRLVDPGRVALERQMELQRKVTARLQEIEKLGKS